jgi:hypothetical protein
MHCFIYKHGNDTFDTSCWKYLDKIRVNAKIIELKKLNFLCSCLHSVQNLQSKNAPFNM